MQRIYAVFSTLNSNELHLYAIDGGYLSKIRQYVFRNPHKRIINSRLGCIASKQQKVRVIEIIRIQISAVTKRVTKFLTLSKSPHCDSIKKFVTHFVTPEIWTLTKQFSNSNAATKGDFNRLMKHKESFITAHAAEETLSTLQIKTALHSRYFLLL